MSTLHRIEFERLRYWQGQTLRAADDRDQRRFDALRRRLHNLALHSTEGVAFGLRVTRIDEDPVTWEVACGLAYDCRGRELLLQRPRRIDMPTQAAWLVLRPRKAGRRSSGASACCVASEPGCIPDEALLLDADFELAWTGGESEPVEGVALARLDAEGVLDAQFRPRQARPLAKPRLARGETVRGDTPWEPWTIQEPDGKGGLRDRVVGVQTHIDTSAAGFTRTPCYIATIQSQTWNLAKTEFAPAFFPHVADATPAGFTFRLLMTEIARRRYEALADFSRVTETTRGVGDRLQVTVAAAAAFRKGDMVAQLRPRSDKVVRVLKSDSSKLTLEAALDGARQGSELAVGNLPRMSKVTEVKPVDPAVLAAVTAAPQIRKGDVLLRMSDGKLAVVDRVTQGKLVVGDPFENWTTADTLMAARPSASVEVKSARVSDDGLKTSIELKPASHAVGVGMVLVLLNENKRPLATVAKVASRSGAIIEVEPVLSNEALTALRRVVPAEASVTVQSLEPASRSTLSVESVGPFAEGDFVAIVGRPGQIALVKDIDEDKKQLELWPPLDNVQVGEHVVAANWRCATTVSAVDVPPTTRVVVGRANAALPGSFVVLRIDDEFSAPVAVTNVQGATLTLATPFVELKRLDTLAVGVFPGIVTVVAQGAQPEQVTIAEPGRLAAGDSVVLLPAAGAAAVRPVFQVVTASGTLAVLSESPGLLNPGQQLACVHWRDRVSLTAVGDIDPTQVEVDGELVFRESDVVGMLNHYADNANPGMVEAVAGNVLTLALPGIEHGDGIVKKDWIDGGIVGPAAVSYLPGAQQTFPSQLQPFVRMKTTDGLERPAQAVAYGLDLLSGRFVSAGVLPLLTDPASGQVALLRLDANTTFRLRPETLSLVTSFNTEFPRAFATFAQKQKLSVRWTACLQEFAPHARCPGQQTHDPCAQGHSSED
ncbi:hypothetical protein [Variovorax sp. RA8]|uniref:hypothetical protein n=1 Tax=Variovorax sp. (strain JCM 16519 / RA8) TaxID=662548 RepID=UPI0013187EA8|nr:hypothetical protein [Variovorax sp. RA8]VTU28785.1 hypothetical protein RA8CHR_03820 [Variovorax sp. RA8]